MTAARCPALFVAAPSSGQGKTTVTAALARLHVRQGRKVRVFKCGPDFLDPQIHAFASGRPCQNLDLGMCGESDARWRLARAAKESDLILVEGVMGLFDGTPSAADSTLSTAPVPRPPQPMRPTLISSDPAAHAPVSPTPLTRVPPTTAAVVVRMKSRREAAPC